MNPSNVEIRRFILDTYSEDDFVDLFCSDYFPQAKNEFAADMSFTRKAQRLIEYCQNRDIVDNLLADLQKERPAAFERWFGHLASQADAVVPAPRSAVHNPHQVFISHAHQDAEFAHRLAHDLQQGGWSVWIAPDSIKPGEKWVASIGRGLDESGVFVTLLTPVAVASDWVKSESDAAIELEHDHQIRLIPLLVQPCPVPTLLRAYQRVSFVDGYEQGLAQLMNALDPVSRPVAVAPSVAQPYRPEQSALQPAPKAQAPLADASVTTAQAPPIGPDSGATTTESTAAAIAAGNAQPARRPTQLAVIILLNLISALLLLYCSVQVQPYTGYTLPGLASITISASLVLTLIVTLGLYLLPGSIRIGSFTVPMKTIALIPAVTSVAGYVLGLAVLVAYWGAISSDYRWMAGVCLIGIGIEAAVIVRLLKLPTAFGGRVSGGREV